MTPTPDQTKIKQLEREVQALKETLDIWRKGCCMEGGCFTVEWMKQEDEKEAKQS